MQERCFLSLEAPIQRVCGYDTPFLLAYESVSSPSIALVYRFQVSFAHNFYPFVFYQHYLPDALRNFEAIKKVVNY